MKRKCDKCDRPATSHSIEILKGEKIETHLCDLHAAEEGLAIKGVNTPVSELLTNFVKLHSGTGTKAGQDLSCADCGLTFAHFREHTLLGCTNCYKVFEPALATLIERAHEGGTHHVGKVPRRAGAGEHRQMRLMCMRKELDEAVAAENFERAAQLRDDIRSFEEQAS